MASLLRLFILIIISAIYAEAKTSTENLIIDESEIYDFSNSSKIEEGDFSEEVPTSSSDYIWIVNLKKGPYASKEDAIKAQLDLKQMLDPTLSNFLNEISLDQRSNPSKTKKINNANLSWMINLKLNVFQSKEKALSIITKIEETQEISENILLTRESIAKKKHKLPAVIQREITGKIFLSQETSPLKKDENFLILITTRGNSLNVRERPSSSSPVIAKLSKGTKVPQIKNDLDGIGKKGWFYVEYEKEKYGWISSSFSKKIIDSSIEIKQPAKLAHKLLEKSQAPEINQIKPDKPIKVLTAKKSLSGTKDEEIISAGKFKSLTAKSSKEITALQLTIKSLRSKLNQIKSDKIRAIESRNLARTELQRTTTETNTKIKKLTSTTDFLQSKLTQFKSDKDKLIKTNNKLQDEIETTIFDNKNNVDSLTTVFASLRSELAHIKSAKANLIKEVNTATNKAKKERLAGNKKFNALKETSSTEIRLLLTKNESLNFKLNQIETDKAKLAEVTKQANVKAKKEQLASAKQLETLKHKNSEEIKSLQTTTHLLRSELNKIKIDKAKLVEATKKFNAKANKEKIESVKRFEDFKDKNSKEIKSLQTMTASLRSELDQVKTEKNKLIETNNQANAKANKEKIESVKRFEDFKDISSKEIKSLQTMATSLRSELDQVKTEKNNLIETNNQANAKAKKEILASNKKFDDLNDKSSKEIKSLQTMTASLRSELDQVKTEKNKLVETNNQANAKANKEILASNKKFDDLNDKSSKEIKSLQTMTASLRSELDQVKTEKNKLIETNSQANAKANKEILANNKKFEDFKDKNSKEIKSLQTMTASLRSELNQVKTEKNNLIETNSQANAKANKEILASNKKFDDLNDKNSKEIKSLQTMTALLRSELDQVKTEKNKLIETNSQANAKANKEILANNKKFDDLNDKNSKEIKSLQTMTASLRSELDQVETEKNKLIESANQANVKANEEKIARIKEFEFLKEKNSKETKSLQTMTASLRSELDQVETEKNKLIESANQANVKANKEKIAKIKELKSLEASKNKETESLKTKIKNLRIVLEKFKKEKLKTAKSRESTSEKIEIERIIRAKEITSLKKQTINLKLELDKTELNRIKAIEEMNRISKRTQAYRVDKEKELNQIKQNNTKEVNSLRIVVSSLQKKLDKFQGGEIRPTQKESLLSPTSKAQRETNSVITSIRKQLAEFKGEKTRTTQNKPLLNTASQSQSEKDYIKKKRKNIISKPSSIVASSESANQNDTPASSMDIVTSHLYDWVNAWQNKKVKQYLAFYSNNFKDSKRSRSKWETYKRRSLRTKSNLFIEISDIKVRFLQEDLIKTTFVQKYKSKRVTDIGVKDIYWKKERNGWNIIKEVWRPL